MDILGAKRGTGITYWHPVFFSMFVGPSGTYLGPPGQSWRHFDTSLPLRLRGKIGNILLTPYSHILFIFICLSSCGRAMPETDGQNRSRSMGQEARRADGPASSLARGPRGRVPAAGSDQLIRHDMQTLLDKFKSDVAVDTSKRTGELLSGYDEQVQQRFREHDQQIGPVPGT